MKAHEHDARPASPQQTLPDPAAVVDACGLTCGALEPLIARHLRALDPGEVLEIRSDRQEAADGIGAWVWLTGHALIAVVEDEPAPHARYYVRKKGSAA
jgi:TusA-related sulfurtransferase